jgi:tetratricopeptide (TPR) repeat protein
MEAQYNLGRLSRLQGKVEEAIAHYEAAPRIRPDDPDARTALVRALATRAAADAQAGRADQAITEFERALSHARVSGNADLADEIVRRLEQYR